MTTETSVFTPSPLLRPEHPSLRSLRRFTPAEGWTTLVLLLGTLLVIAWTVTDAEWADTPSLYGIIILSSFMGLGVAKAPGQPIAWHLAAVVFGAGFVYWQLSTVTETTGFVESFREVNSRLNAWGETASTGGISTDTIPFAAILAAVAWTIGYFSTWAAFRKRHIWLTVLPGGIAMFSNLSYLPDEFGPQMFLYLAFAMLLVVRIHSLNQARVWQQVGFLFPRRYSLYAVYRGAWYVLIVLAIAVLLPARSAQVSWLDTAWEWARSPIRAIEGDLDRLFAALPDRKGGGFRSFGVYLPFQGPISLSDEPIFLLDASVPTYLRARAYPNYTAQGWTTGEVAVLPIAGSLPRSQPRDDQSRLELEYTVSPLFKTENLPVSNLPLASANQVETHVLSPQRHWLPLIPPFTGALNLPDDLSAALALLWNADIPRETKDAQVETLLRLLPPDVTITEVVFQDTILGGTERAYLVPEAADGDEIVTFREALEQDDRVLSWVRVMRRPPEPPDVLALRSPKAIAPGEGYTVTSSVSSATPEELRAAGVNYPGWVTDTYLQLPDNLPQRVRGLARDLTRGISNPYDKAKAIESYLHTLPYDQDIPAPAFNADGVDHFLFGVGRGYSDYFGSAMAVLLREAGVPARMVAGYAPREFDEASGNYVVREADSHGWAEAYFPGYGWVEFEPTPNRSMPNYATTTLPDIPISGGDAFDEFLEEEEFLEDEGFEPFTLPNAAEESGAVDGRIIAGVLGGIFTLWLVWYVYRRLFVSITAPDVVFERMCVLGAFAGLPYVKSQTPAEYSRRLAAALPIARRDLGMLGNAHAMTRYSPREITPAETAQLGRAWRNVRRLLVRRALWRNPFRED